MTPSVPAGEQRAVPLEQRGECWGSNGRLAGQCASAWLPTGTRSADRGERRVQAFPSASAPRPDRGHADVLLSGERRGPHPVERLEESLPALGRQCGEAPPPATGGPRGPRGPVRPPRPPHLFRAL